MAFFYFHPTPLRYFLARTLKLSHAIALWMRTEGTHSELDVTPGGRAGVWPRRVQNSFYSNIVMLHIKSNLSKSRIQLCKTFTLVACLGVKGGQKVGLWVLFFFFF